MDTSMVVDLGRQALWMTILISAPMLAVALLVGLVIGVFQAATSINEQTLSFIPKLVALVVALVVMGPWMVQMWLGFTRNLFMNIPAIIG